MPDPITPASIPPTNGTPTSASDFSQITPGQGVPSNGVQSPNLAFPAMGGATLPEGSLTRDQVQALTTSWQQRVSELQSQKDKAIAERDKSISLQVQMQERITSLEASSSAGLSSAADAAQNAINAATQIRAENEMLKGELQRYKALESHPDLPNQYREFLPVNGTEEQMNAAIAKLKAIREQDLARVAAGQQSLFPQGQNPQTPPANAVNPALNPFQALYGNRPNVNPMAMNNPGMGVPGSTPAAMSPAGAGNTTQALTQLMREAMDSGKYEELRERALTLLPQAINEQLGH